MWLFAAPQDVEKRESRDEEASSFDAVEAQEPLDVGEGVKMLPFGASGQFPNRASVQFYLEDSRVTDLNELVVAHLQHLGISDTLLRLLKTELRTLQLKRSWLHSDLITEPSELLSLFQCAKEQEAKNAVEKIAVPEKPENTAWMAMPSMLSRRSGLGVGVLENCVYAFGGSDGHRRLASCERYDIAAGEWQALPPMLAARSGLSVAVVDKRVYALGGYDGVQCLAYAEAYDPALGMWQELPSMSWRRGWLAAAVLDGFLFAVGGSDGLQSLASAEVFDVREHFQWQQLPSMSFVRSRHAMAVLEGKLHVVGGYDGTQCLASAEVFGGNGANAWRQLLPMVSRRCWHTLTVSDGKLIALGGSNGESSLSSAEIYDPSKGDWFLLPPMSAARSGLTAVSMLGRIYALGGFDGTECLASTEAFDLASGEWVALPPTSTARSGYTAVAAGGKIYAVGGFDGQKCLDSAEMLLLGPDAVRKSLARAHFSEFSDAAVGEQIDKVGERTIHLIRSIQALSCRHLAMLLLGDSAAGWSYRRSMLLLQTAFSAWEGLLRGCSGGRATALEEASGRLVHKYDKVKDNMAAMLWKHLGPQSKMASIVQAWHRAAAVAKLRAEADAERKRPDEDTEQLRGALQQEAATFEDAEARLAAEMAALPEGVEETRQQRLSELKHADQKSLKELREELEKEKGCLSEESRLELEETKKRMANREMEILATLTDNTKLMVPVVWQAWQRAVEIAKLEGASEEFQRFKAGLSEKLVHQLAKAFSPKASQLQAFRAWVQHMAAAKEAELQSMERCLQRQERSEIVISVFERLARLQDTVLMEKVFLHWFELANSENLVKMLKDHQAQATKEESRAFREKAAKVLWSMNGPKATERLFFDEWKGYWQDARAGSAVKQATAHEEAAEAARDQAIEFEIASLRLQRALKDAAETMQKEREAQLKALESTNMSMKELQVALGESSKRSAQEIEVLKAEMRRRQAEVLELVFGKSDMLLPMVFYPWQRLALAAKLEAASEEYKRLTRSLGPEVMEKFKNVFSPKVVLLRALAGWAKSVALSKAELAKREENEVEQHERAEVVISVFSRCQKYQDAILLENAFVHWRENASHETAAHLRCEAEQQLAEAQRATRARMAGALAKMNGDQGLLRLIVAEWTRAVLDALAEAAREALDNQKQELKAAMENVATTFMSKLYGAAAETSIAFAGWRKLCTTGLQLKAEAHAAHEQAEREAKQVQSIKMVEHIWLVKGPRQLLAATFTDWRALLHNAALERMLVHTGAREEKLKQRAAQSMGKLLGPSRIKYAAFAGWRREVYLQQTAFSSALIEQSQQQGLMAMNSASLCGTHRSKCAKGVLERFAMQEDSWLLTRLWEHWKQEAMSSIYTDVIESRHEASMSSMVNGALEVLAANEDSTLVMLCIQQWHRITKQKKMGTSYQALTFRANQQAPLRQVFQYWRLAAQAVASEQAAVSEASRLARAATCDLFAKQRGDSVILQEVVRGWQLVAWRARHEATMQQAVSEADERAAALAKKEKRRTFQMEAALAISGGRFDVQLHQMRRYLAHWRDQLLFEQVARALQEYYIDIAGSATKGQDLRSRSDAMFASIIMDCWANSVLCTRMSPWMQDRATEVVLKMVRLWVLRRHSSVPQWLAEQSQTAFATKLYVVGGSDGLQTLQSAECFDPEGEAWLQLPSLSRRRTRLSCASLFGRLYAVGGWDGKDAMPAVEVYDQRTGDCWRPWLPMALPERFCGFAMAALDEKLYALAGFA
eukprot:TRINITY_DN37787_c0_g1_i3.p1 TRINITY_DN37787_c0_g1~~TRINITY_DN37787_c0_g1_i3.p1  ORF type:complete len:1763 (-),score=459.89 TRINITY_DN37787_c0_g1_i3:869-6157(-)